VSAALVEELRAEVESLRELARGATATALAQATELAVLRAQLPPLLAVHDALVAAAALPGAGASGEAMVAAVRAQASADAREDLARIGRLVGCDSLVGVEIHAAVEHELLERDAARDAAERAERERDDALAEVETMRAENDLLLSVIEGRTTPPTDAESAAHEATGGAWLVWWGRESYTVHHGPLTPRRPPFRPWSAARTWLPLRDGRPCAWPTVTP
jgi:hypothetical protein